jgi:hypothetical protein
MNFLLVISDAASVITILTFLVMLPGAWSSMRKWLRERRHSYWPRHATSPLRAWRSRREGPSSCSTVRPAHRHRAHHRSEGPPGGAERLGDVGGLGGGHDDRPLVVTPRRISLSMCSQATNRAA